MAKDKTTFAQYDHHLSISFSGQTGLKIYQLQSMYLAEDSLVRRCLEDAKSRYEGTLVRGTIHLERVRDELFETTASYLLLEIAICMRVIDDHFGRVYPMSDKLPTCGLLTPDEDSDRAKPLAFREACNKIIHGQGHSFDRTELGKSAKYRTEPLYKYEPMVVYRGEKDKKKWRANLHVIPFCEAGARLWEVAFIH